MKKLLLLIFLVIGSASVMAQTLVQNTAYFSVPEGFERPSKTAMTKYLHSRKDSKIAFADTFPGIIYKFGDMVFQINAGEVPVLGNRLENIKKGFEDVYRNVPGKQYTGQIKSINNNHAYVMHLVSSSYSYYNFGIVNSANNKLVKGILEYNHGNDLKAKEISTKIINSIKFK